MHKVWPFAIWNWPAGHGRHASTPALLPAVEKRPAWHAEECGREVSVVGKGADWQELLKLVIGLFEGGQTRAEVAGSRWGRGM